MKAVRIDKFGPVSGLTVVEAHNPSPRPGEAIVEVRAASINVSDVKNALGVFKQTVLPRIPGRDYSGVVVQGPRNYLGLEVWGTGGDLGFTRDGTHAQLVAIPVTALKTKPRKLTFEQAGAVGVPAVTALSALKISLIKPEKTLLVIGAAGGVGSMAVQIAKWKGCHVIGGVLDANGVQHAKDAGAESTVLIGKQDLKAVVADLTHGHGVDVVLNTAGSEMVEPALSCLTVGGRLVVINAGAQPRVSFDLPDFYHRELRILGLNTLNLDMVNSTAILHELATGYDSGLLQPPSTKTLPLEQASVGYQLVEKGLAARLVLVPNQNS